MALDAESLMGAPSPSVAPTASAAGVVPTAMLSSSAEIPNHSALRVRLVVFDLLAATLGWVRLGGLVESSAGFPRQLACAAAGVLASMVSLSALGLYRSRTCAKWSREVLRVLITALIAGLCFSAAEWSLLRLRPKEIALSTAIFALSCLAMRGYFRLWLNTQRRNGRYLRNVVVVGDGDSVAELHKMLSSEPELGYRVTAIINPSAAQNGNIVSSTNVADLPSLAKETGANGAVVVPTGMTHKDLQWSVALAAQHGLHLQLWPGILGVASVRLRELPLLGEPFYYVEPHVVSPWQLSVKRAIDVTGSAVGLVVFSPVLVLGAIAIKLAHDGPVLHRQQRVGLHHAEFTLYKLRTMAVGSREPQLDELPPINERTDGPLYKNAKDPRITRVGRLLRPLSLDELPQLWNVLNGTMSLIGPRPALPQEVLHFDDELKLRHTMRPGITGLWQSRARENPSFHAYRRFDLQYVNNWSLRLDLTVAMLTVPAVVTQAVHGLRPAPATRRSSPELRDLPDIAESFASALEIGVPHRALDPASRTTPV